MHQLHYLHSNMKATLKVIKKYTACRLVVYSEEVVTNLMFIYFLKSILKLEFQIIQVCGKCSMLLLFYYYIILLLLTKLLNPFLSLRNFA